MGELVELLCSYLSNGKHLQHHHNLPDSWIPLHIIMEYKAMKKFTINQVVAIAMTHKCIETNDNFSALKWIGTTREKLKRRPKAIQEELTIFKCTFLPGMDKQVIKTMMQSYGHVQYINQHYDSESAFVHMLLNDNTNDMVSNTALHVVDTFKKQFPSFSIDLLNFGERQVYEQNYKRTTKKPTRKKPILHKIHKTKSTHGTESPSVERITKAINKL